MIPSKQNHPCCFGGYFVVTYIWQDVAKNWNEKIVPAFNETGTCSTVFFTSTIFKIIILQIAATNLMHLLSPIERFL